jgi:hypothetical protein
MTDLYSCSISTFWSGIYYMNRVVAWEDRIYGSLLWTISLNNHVSEVKCTRHMERSEQLDSTPRSAQAVIYSSECFGLLRLEGREMRLVAQKLPPGSLSR